MGIDLIVSLHSVHVNFPLKQQQKPFLPENMLKKITNY